ncbi:hypothetical protein K457DRAFT_889264 [Linnemannia elongata AG-77]|uniref:Uncharacterized protein n=1 Tax=Linnemannia elongata AG-77 TaxID=1314771 RepID=A0A197K3W5_9FUNG|nr:hypothetical protein K457DRAFT_889264 [Linnemannia elongata AG-77]
MTPFPAAGGYPIYADSGPLHGQNVGNAAAFLGRRSVRNAWIAVSVLWVVWAMLFLARQTFGPTRVYNAPRSGGVGSSGVPVSADQGPYDVQNGVGPTSSGGVGTGGVGTGVTGSGVATTGVSGHHGTAARGGFFTRAVDNVRDRIDRTYKLIRDLTLMLLLVVALNSFGLGSGTAVLILSWIFVAVALFWAGLIMLIESRIIDLLLGTLEMLLLLGIFICAYALGWSVLD